jgi:hypothetical protein
MIRCFKRITFDESFLNNNPTIESYQDSKSIALINNNFIFRGLKIFDPNFAIALL